MFQEVSFLQLDRKKCVRCSKYFTPRKTSHDLCYSCFADKIGSTPNRVYISKIFELRQKIGSATHLTINCCEQCQLPFIVSTYESNRKKLCPDCVHIRRKERGVNYSKKHRKELIQSRGNKCEQCSYNNINVLEIHHKDRDRSNDTNENIEVLCANCHTIEHKKAR